MTPYDTIILECPRCGKPYSVESFTGQRLMMSYPLSMAPADVLVGINHLAPYRCKGCQLEFYVRKFNDGVPRTSEWTRDVWPIPDF